MKILNKYNNISIIAEISLIAEPKSPKELKNQPKDNYTKFII